MSVDRELLERLLLVHCPHLRGTADALLPVVRAVVADELRDAADAAHDEYSGWEAAAVVRARAEELDSR